MKHTVQIEFPRQGVWRWVDRWRWGWWWGGGRGAVGRKAILLKNEYAVRERCEMNKNIHTPGAAGELRRGGGLERKDAGESPGRHQDAFQMIPLQSQRPVPTQFKPNYQQ